MGLPHCELLGNGISRQQELGCSGLVGSGGPLRFRIPAKELGVLCQTHSKFKVLGKMGREVVCFVKSHEPFRLVSHFIQMAAR